MIESWHKIPTVFTSSILKILTPANFNLKIDQFPQQVITRHLDIELTYCCLYLATRSHSTFGLLEMAHSWKTINTCARKGSRYCGNSPNGGRSMEDQTQEQTRSVWSQWAVTPAPGKHSPPSWNITMLLNRSESLYGNSRFSTSSSQESSPAPPVAKLTALSLSYNWLLLFAPQVPHLA